MKLKNKKTGEIKELQDILSDMIDNHIVPTLIVVENEWEYYEEPKYFYCISIDGLINKYEVERYAHESWCKNGAKIIGNYFSSREEAERAVKKLKAWKRLKDRGLHVTTFYVEDGSLVIRAKTHNSSGAENWEDLDLLFGGEK